MATSIANIYLEDDRWELQQVGKESAVARNMYQMSDAVMFSRWGHLSPAWKWEVVNYRLGQGLDTDKRHVQYSRFETSSMLYLLPGCAEF